jgi:REP element-mobilizing transposase RayT
VLPFPAGRGGRRRGSGRKPKGERAGVSHHGRAAHAKRFPVHVTVKVQRGLPRLRLASAYAALRAAFAAGRSGGGSATGAFRLCHYAILNDHLHFLVEADDRTALTRGVQGLLIRIARALNKLWQRKGKVLAGRFHDRALKTPREVRNAIRYVLGNARKHAAQGGEIAVPHAIDLFTSAPWFDGFRESIVVHGIATESRPVIPADTWLLTKGWRRHGLLSIHELPATG